MFKKFARLGATPVSHTCTLAVLPPLLLSRSPSPPLPLPLPLPARQALSSPSPSLTAAVGGERRIPAALPEASDLIVL